MERLPRCIAGDHGEPDTPNLSRLAVFEAGLDRMEVLKMLESSRGSDCGTIAADAAAINTLHKKSGHVHVILYVNS